MKKFIWLFVTILVFLFGCEKSKGFNPPELTGKVVDTSNTLSKIEKQDIEYAIANFEKNTGGQFAVCIVPNMNGETVESASMKVAEKWKIGKKGKDNGIIFFLSMKEREFRIEVGYGYEGKINDAKAGDLGRNAISFFKKKQWTHGIISIINGSSNIISGKSVANVQEGNEELTLKDIVGIVIFVVIVMIIVFALFANSGSGGDGAYIIGGSNYRSGGGSSYGGFGGSFGGGGFSGKF